MSTTIADQLALFIQENQIVFAAIVIGGTAIGIKVLDFVFKKTIVGTLSRRVNLQHLDGRLIGSIRIPLYFAVILAGLRIGLTGVALLDPYSVTLDQIFYVGSLILAALIVLRAIDIAGLLAGRIWFKRTKANTYSLILPLSRLGKGLTIFLIGVSVLAVFGINVTNILFGWGLLGFAIVLALQPIILDIFAGLSIASQGALKVGQRVILNSGEVVAVEAIQLQKTVFRDLLTGSMHSMSNSELMKQKMTILEDGVLPVPIPFKVAYNEIGRVINLAMQVGNDMMPHLAKRPVVNIRELDSDNNKAKLELFLWISDASKRDYVITQASTKLVDMLRKNAVLTE